MLLSLREFNSLFFSFRGFLVPKNSHFKGVVESFIILEERNLMLRESFLILEESFLIL